MDIQMMLTHIFSLARSIFCRWLLEGRNTRKNTRGIDSLDHPASPPLTSLLPPDTDLSASAIICY